MRRGRFLVVILLLAFSGCAHVTEPVEKKEGTYAPVEASLCHINQKVASHFLISGIPDGFNEAQYEAAVKEVCYSNPVCKSRAETIFDSYEIDARKIDDMFSVMLCDKETKWKIMEDFNKKRLGSGNGNTVFSLSPLDQIFPISFNVKDSGPSGLAIIHWLLIM